MLLSYIMDLQGSNLDQNTETVLTGAFCSFLLPLVNAYIIALSMVQSLPSTAFQVHLLMLILSCVRLVVCFDLVIRFVDHLRIVSIRKFKSLNELHTQNNIVTSAHIRSSRSSVVVSW